jgi:hypothetical protein
VGGLPLLSFHNLCFTPLQVLFLLETWVRICTDAAAGAGSDKTYHQYLAVLSQQGVLASDGATERFFRVMLDLCVQSCAATSKLHGGPEPGSAPSSIPTPRTRLLYTGVDALSKLVVLLVKVADGISAKVALLQRLLTIFARALLRDADDKGAGSSAPEQQPTTDGAVRFDQRPHMRLLANLLRDLNMPVRTVGGSCEVECAHGGPAVCSQAFLTAAAVGRSRWHG